MNKKSNITSQINLKNNVYLIRERENVRCPQFSQVKWTLNAFKFIKSLNIKHKYIDLISGQDFLLKNLDYF